MQTKYTFDTNGNTTKREIYDQTGGGETVYNYIFDSNARLATTILPNGNGTSYTYDSKGNIAEERQKTVATAANSSSDLVTDYTYDSTYNIPLSVTFPNGLTKSFTLNSGGNILTESDAGILNADGSTYDTTASYTYDNSGELATKTDAEGNVTTYGYVS